MSKKYKFRREDNGEIVEVGFDEMMNASNGMLKLEVGGKIVWAKRIQEGPLRVKGKRQVIADMHNRKVVADNLGFAASAFDEMEADRKLHGFSDVEFVRDKEVPGFYQAVFTNRSAYLRYARHRGFVDRTSKNGSGAMLAPGAFDAAREKVLRQHPIKKDD